jgi:hypothetical protein
MRLLKVGVLVSVLAASATFGFAGGNGLVVHEWGTFTSIAGKDGFALDYRPLQGTVSDLPSFVYSSENLPRGLRGRYLVGKNVNARVRMETPVLYFYSDTRLEVSVKVDFPLGKITEFYPRANAVDHGIDWGTFAVAPGSSDAFPRGHEDNPYYRARETDAAPLSVCDREGTEHEKFLFYRGVGTFDLPLTVARDRADHFAIANVGAEKVAGIVLFRREGDRSGFELVKPLAPGEKVTVHNPALPCKIPHEMTRDSLEEKLVTILVEQGLYAKEATAMVATWRDTWFEDGVRAFYIFPRPATDRVLPITISPEPASLVRVLVGRIEVLTPEQESRVRALVVKLGDDRPLVRDEASAAIRKLGRFFRPLLVAAKKDAADAEVVERLRQILED